MLVSIFFTALEHFMNSELQENKSMSYDDVIPKVKQWVESFPTHQEQVNASTRFNYALTDVLDAANSHTAEQYGWTYVMTILSTPQQLLEALQKAKTN